MYKIVAVNESYGHHGHSEKGRVIEVSESELRASAKSRKLPDTALFPLPHFRFVSEELNKKASEALKAGASPEKPAAEPAKTEPAPKPQKDEKPAPGKKGKGEKSAQDDD
ncbi:MAG: hypothetical protein HY079_06325 [Elusimicrobia bacterium]|nr:hypothetical protein [Elusimicrobiota bacterium]